MTTLAMAAALNIASLAEKGLNIAFTTASDLTRSATYYRVTDYQWNATTGKLDEVTTTKACKIIVLPYLPEQINGVDIKQGDERILVRSSELSGLTNPGPGDYIIEAGGIRRNVKASFLDSTGKLYEFQGRKPADDEPEDQAGAQPIDWGSLATKTESEAWGDMTALDSKDNFGKVA